MCACWGWGGAVSTMDSSSVLPTGRMWVPWAAPTPPDNCLNWALIRETGGKKPSFSLPGERINQVSLKTDDVCTLQLRVGEGLGWATWKSTG